MRCTNTSPRPPLPSSQLSLNFIFTSFTVLLLCVSKASSVGVEIATTLRYDRQHFALDAFAAVRDESPTWPSTRPPRGSLFWKLWYSNMYLNRRIRDESAFVRGVRDGNLDPDRYGGWMVSDAYYCFAGATTYGVAAERARQIPGMHRLAAFLDVKKREYDAFNDAVFVSGWNLIVPNTTTLSGLAKHINATHVIKRYAAFERRVARKLHPVYTLVSQLPCEVVWSWLGAQLSAHVNESNVYRNWAYNNVWDEAGYAIGNFLQSFSSDSPGILRENTARWIYRKSTRFEFANFNDI